MSMLKISRQFMLSAIAGLTYLSCNTNQVDPVDATPMASYQAMRASFNALEGDWVLTNYKNAPLPATLQNRSTLTLKKQANDSLQVGGRSFVNYYGGAFTLDEAKGLIVSADPLISTKIGGSAEDMQAETTYYNLLSKATFFELSTTGQLLLYAGPKGTGSTEVLYFTKK